MSKTIPASTIKAIIDRAWWDLVHCTQSHFSRELQDALHDEVRDERAHRRMGARFTNGQARYRLSSEYSAKLLVLKHLWNAPTECRDMADLGGLRDAVVKCYVLAARMRMRKSISRNGADTMLMANWHERACTRTLNSKGVMVGGMVLHLGETRKAERELRHILAERIDADASLYFSGPIFAALDYATDIAANG